MALDLRATRVTKNQDGTFLVKYEAFDTDSPEVVTAEISVQGKTRAEIVLELVRKYELWRSKTVAENDLLTIANEAVEDAKAVILSRGGAS